MSLKSGLFMKLLQSLVNLTVSDRVTRL